MSFHSYLKRNIFSLVSNMIPHNLIPYILPSAALLHLEALGGAEEGTGDTDQLLGFLKRGKIEQRHLDVGIFTLDAVLLGMADLRNAALDGIALHEEFVRALEVARDNHLA